MTDDRKRELWASADAKAAELLERLDAVRAELGTTALVFSLVGADRMADELLEIAKALQAVNDTHTEALRIAGDELRQARAVAAGVMA